MWQRLYIGWLKWKLRLHSARYRRIRSSFVYGADVLHQTGSDSYREAAEINRLLDELAQVDTGTPTERISL